MTFLTFNDAMWLFVAVINSLNLWLSIRNQRRADAYIRQLQEENAAYRRTLDETRLPNGVLPRRHD